MVWPARRAHILAVDDESFDVNGRAHAKTSTGASTATARCNIADAGRAALVHNVLHILVSEVAQRAQHRIGRRHAQSAQTGFLDRAAQDRPADRDRPCVAIAVADSRQQRKHLRGAGAAGNAFAAGLRHAELHEEAGHIDHARGVVHDDHAAGAHHGADADQRLVADLQVEMLFGNAAARRAASLHSLEFVTVRNAAADAFDDLSQAHAHGHFDQAGVGDLAGQREDLGALAACRADCREPFAALANDGSDVGESLDIVDQRWLAPQSAYGWIRGPGFGCAALAFDRRDQGGLFAADKCAGAEANLDVEVERRAADVACRAGRAAAHRAGSVQAATASGYSART